MFCDSRNGSIHLAGFESPLSVFASLVASESTYDHRMRNASERRWGENMSHRFFLSAERPAKAEPRVAFIGLTFRLD